MRMTRGNSTLRSNQKLNCKSFLGKCKTANNPGNLKVMLILVVSITSPQLLTGSTNACTVKLLVGFRFLGGSTQCILHKSVIGCDW